VEINKWMTQRKRLSHANQRVVNSTVTVWVIARHGVAGNARALDERAVGAETLLVHVPNDSAVNWL
jgi:hypothetical protein